MPLYFSCLKITIIIKIIKFEEETKAFSLTIEECLLICLPCVGNTAELALVANVCVSQCKDVRASGTDDPVPCQQQHWGSYPGQCWGACPYGTDSES